MSVTTRTDVLLSAITAEIEGRRSRLDAVSSSGEVKMVLKFSRVGMSADTMTFRFVFGTKVE